jgi:hypothetical protein
MSEIAIAPAAAPETAATAPEAGAVPQATTEAPAAPRVTARDIVEGRAPARTAPVVDANGRPHAPETGQFVPADPSTPAADTAPGPDPAAPAAAPPTDPAAVPAPASTVKIAIAEDHPLRHRLGAEVEAPAGLEELIRHSLNQPVYRRAVDEAVATSHAAQAEAAQLRAAIGALNQQLGLAYRDPSAAQQVAEIRAALGDDAADRHLQVLLSQAHQAADQEASQVAETIAQQRVAEQGEAFAASLVQGTRGRYTVWGDSDHVATLFAYEGHLEHRAAAGDRTPPSLADYQAFADRRYIMHPSVLAEAASLRDADLARVRAEAERTVREQVAAEQRRVAEEAALRSRNNVMGRLPATGTGHQVPAGAQRVTTQEYMRTLGLV